MPSNDLDTFIDRVAAAEEAYDAASRVSEAAANDRAVAWTQFDDAMNELQDEIKRQTAARKTSKPDTADWNSTGHGSDGENQ